MQTIKKILSSYIPIGLILIGILYFHWHGFQPEYTFLPVDLARNNLPWREGAPSPLQNWLISDPLYEFYPFLTQRLNSLQQGEWLLWSKDIFLGHPSFADPLFQTFYPVPLAFAYLWGPIRGFTINLLFHLILAAFFSYHFVRSVGFGKPAATALALTYVLSGYMITWLEHTHRVSTMAWLPAILWMYQLVLQTRRWRYIALGGLSLGFAILSGQLQHVMFFLFLFGLYSIGWSVYLVTQKNITSTLIQKYWPIVSALLLGIIGVLIGGVQLVSFAEYLEMSHRRVSQAFMDPLPISQLISLVFPDYYGNPTRSAYWGASNYSAGTIYAGIVVLYLGLIALIAKRKFWVLCLGVLLIGTLYFATGGPGVAYREIISFLKYLSLRRSVFIVPLLVSGLAIFVIERPRVSIRAISVSLLTLIAMTSVLTFISWNEQSAEILLELSIPAAILVFTVTLILVLTNLRPNFALIASWLLVGLIFADLLYYGQSFNPAGKVRNLMPSTPLIEYLQEQPANERVVALQRDGNLLFGPNILPLFGLIDPGGYSSLVKRRYHEIVSQDDPEIDIHWARRGGGMMLFSYPSSRLLDLLSTRYIVSSEILFDPGPESEFIRTDCIGSTDEVRAGIPITGTFAARSTAINRLDILYKIEPDVMTDGNLIVRIWEGENKERLFVEAVQNVADIANEPQKIVYFAPEKDAPGKTYVWEISTESENTGVRMCTGEQGEPSISVYGMERIEVFKHNDIYVYERLAPFAHASIVYAAQHVPDDSLANQYLLDKSFDLRNIALSSEQLALPPSSHLPANQAEIIEYSNSRVVINAVAKEAGLLVLNDQYHPGWKAQIDGVTAPVLRVNKIMRGVFLPQGTHEIVFTFLPSSALRGAGLSLSGIGIVLFLVILDIRARRLRVKDE